MMRFFLLELSKFPMLRHFITLYALSEKSRSNLFNAFEHLKTWCSRILANSETQNKFLHNDLYDLKRQLPAIQLFFSTDPLDFSSC